MAKVTDDGVSYPAYLFNGLATDSSSDAGPVSAAADDIFGTNPLTEGLSDPHDILFGGSAVAATAAVGTRAARGARAPSGVTMYGLDPEGVSGPHTASRNDGVMDLNGAYDPLAWGSTLKKSISNKKTDGNSDPMSMVDGARQEMSKYTGGDPLSYSSQDASADGAADSTTDSGGDPSTDPGTDPSGDTSVDPTTDPSSP